MQQYGSFEGDVETKWDGDGRRMTLLKSFAYVGPDSVRWDAPAGSVVDGASIPQFAWSLIGGPFEGLYRDPSVIHDVACDAKVRAWESVHMAFYTAMLARNVNGIKAKVMYGAVYHFGPRWPLQLNIGRGGVSLVRDFTSIGRAAAFDLDAEATQPIEVEPAPYSLAEGDFDRLRLAIEQGDLSLSDIRDFAG
ncbi:MAG TPA: DUF1353 domain-containing protein [Thermoanaerobaculia bacterium]|nr:DUF1353 domain-containing protein [Thermoanaerobaculia bacterium]